MLNNDSNGSSSGAATSIPAQYQDPLYQQAHAKTFLEAGTPPVPQIYPPGVSEVDFKRAIEEFRSVVGATEVVTGDRLVEYVDPYELEEEGPNRKLPSAAVR